MTLSKFEELKARFDAGNTTGIWWTPAVDRWSNQTGAAHIVHHGGLLCGANPFTTGGSFASAAEAGAHECKRCRNILNKVIHHANAGTEQRIVLARCPDGPPRPL